MGAAKVQLCRCRYEICGCKINDLMKEETGTSILFYPPWPLGSPDPYPAPISARSFSFYPALLRLPLPQNCWLPRTRFRFRNCVRCASQIASDAHPRAAISSSNTSPRLNRVSGIRHWASGRRAIEKRPSRSDRREATVEKRPSRRNYRARLSKSGQRPSGTRHWASGRRAIEKRPSRSDR